MTERDWESMARARLEHVVAGSVARLRATADQLEREAARGIRDAAEGRHEWSSYGRVAGQFVHELVNGVNNTNLSNLIETAADADAARLAADVDVARIGRDS